MKDADFHKLYAKQKLRDSFCCRIDDSCNVTSINSTTALEHVVVFLSSSSFNVQSFFLLCHPFLLQNTPSIQSSLEIDSQYFVFSAESYPKI